MGAAELECSSAGLFKAGDPVGIETRVSENRTGR